MDSVLRAAAIYLVLLVLFRVAGRRTLSEMTSFDFVLLLVIGEATQQALLGEDFSLINAVLVIVTLIMLDVLISWVTQRSRIAGKLVEGVPMVIVADGKPLHDRMRKARIELATSWRLPDTLRGSSAWTRSSTLLSRPAAASPLSRRNDEAAVPTNYAVGVSSVAPRLTSV